MNRTLLLLSAAAVLAVVALTAGSSPPPKAAVAPPAVAVAVAAPAPVLAPVAPAAVASGALTLTGRLSSARVLTGASTTYVKLDVAAPETNAKPQRVPVNLAVVIDHSGSMSGNKMVQARNAAHALVDQLKAGDRLAIIAFDDSISSLPSAAVSKESAVGMHAFIDRIYESGGTNISAGLEAGYDAVRPYAKDYKVSRVVLLSDGQPSSGDLSIDGLSARATRARDYRITTSAFGIGLDFNAALMRDLANHGAGGYSFIENAANLGLAFAHELGDAAQTAARDVQVMVNPGPGVAIADVPGHAFTRVGNAVQVGLYDFAPGQSAQLLVKLSVTAGNSGTVKLGQVELTYVDLKEERPARGVVALVATVAGSAAEVGFAADPEVLEMAKRVDISQRVVEAQAAYQRGDTQLAFSMMDNVRRLFGPSADALAGSTDEVEGNWARGGADAQRTNMLLTKKTMKNFGQNNTSAY